MAGHPKRLVWLVDTLDKLRGFPAKDGFGETVWQVRADDPAGTYRAVYTAQFQDAVCVLHAFQKKAKSGIATPRRELALIKQRLQLARRLAGGKGD